MSASGETNTTPHLFPITVLHDHGAIAKAAAERIAAQLRAKPDLVLGLATGATMQPVYAELVRMHKEEGLDFSHARFFNLDAYKGVPASDRNSYSNQLHKMLVDHVNATPSNVHFVQGDHFNPQAYEKQIKQAGGIDIQLLGLGGEGHIGFNEVGSPANSRTREVTLSDRTRTDNAMYFNKPGERMPTHAYTMGIGTILEAKELLVLANNPNKALILSNLLATPPAQRSFVSRLGKSEDHSVEALPARALYLHPNVHVLVDEEAACMVQPHDLAARSNLNTPQVRALRKKFASETLTFSGIHADQPLILSPNFDFYDPATMKIDEPFDRHNPKHQAALAKALSHATDIAIGAHPDDVEIMAGGIQLQDVEDKKPTHWLSVIVTDGAASNSMLVGSSGSKTQQEKTAMRQQEQRDAAKLTGVPVIQMKYPSAAVNDHMGAAKKAEAAEALSYIFAAAPNTERVYGHNPIDKHDTHLGVLACQTAALRAAANPKLKHVYGMEVWGGLTGVEPFLSMFPVSTDVLTKLHDVLQCYQSQIEWQGRDYAKTTVARLEGHGGYVTNPHLSDPPAGMVIGLDITDLVKGPVTQLDDYAKTLLDKATALKVKQASHNTLPVIGNHFQQKLEKQTANKTRDLRS